MIKITFYKKNFIFILAYTSLYKLISKNLNTCEKNIEQLESLEHLITLEKHTRTEQDYLIIIDYLLKTDLFKGLKSIKIDLNNYINLLITIATSSDLESYENKSTIYKISEVGNKFYIILKGSVSLHKPKDEKKNITQLEYLDFLKDLSFRKEKVLLEKTIFANNLLLYINNIDDEREIKDIFNRENLTDGKLNFSIYKLSKVSTMEAFKNFGDRALETRSRKKAETAITDEDNTIILKIDESIYKEKISKELNNYRMRETKFLNENFFFNDVSRFNFNKIFELFHFKEFKKGDIVIQEKDNHAQNFIYFIREGILDITINLNLIELLKLIKELVYKKNNFIKSFYNTIDLEMKNQPEKYIEEIRKYRVMNLFRLTSFDVVGSEQLFFDKKDLYQVTAISDIVKVYRLNLDDIKRIFAFDKKSYNNFSNYLSKKMKNLLTRLIACKDMIVNKLENTNGLDNLNLNSKKNNLNKNEKNWVEIFATLENLAPVKQQDSELTEHHIPKKYKIIEEKGELNILSKNNKLPRELMKDNDKMFSLINTTNRYRIPNIEKVIEDIVKKNSEPFSAKNKDMNRKITKSFLMNKYFGFKKKIKKKEKIENENKNNMKNSEDLSPNNKRDNFCSINNYEGSNKTISNSNLNNFSTGNLKNKFKNIENMLKNQNLNSILVKTQNLKLTQNKNKENYQNISSFNVNYLMSNSSMNLLSSSTNLNENNLMNIYNISTNNLNCYNYVGSSNNVNDFFILNSQLNNQNNNYKSNININNGNCRIENNYININTENNIIDNCGNTKKLRKIENNKENIKIISNINNEININENLNSDWNNEKIFISNQNISEKEENDNNTCRNNDNNLINSNYARDRNLSNNNLDLGK